MVDPIFSNPRLAAIYDAFDGQRSDLDYYLAIVKELGAQSVLDIGCGTGCFACMLSQNGVDAIGVDPAEASLDMARQKPGAEKIRWVLGDATSLPKLSVDMAVMTGNVAQVFTDDTQWAETLRAIHQKLRPHGHLVFEVRDPVQKAWLTWTKEHSYQRLNIPNVGPVEGWCRVIDVSGECIRFRWTYTFESDGKVVESDSTLRFRDKDTITKILEETGYIVKEIRGAPDRPNQEFVFIAARAQT